jgi:hypothetical protein
MEIRLISGTGERLMKSCKLERDCEAHERRAILCPEGEN